MYEGRVYRIYSVYLQVGLPFPIATKRRCIEAEEKGKRGGGEREGVYEVVVTLAISIPAVAPNIRLMSP